jgi:hypothetical protein
LRQVGLARADFAAIEDQVDFIKAQLARVPTRMELARIAPGIMFGAAGLVIGWIEVFWRHCFLSEPVDCCAVFARRVAERPCCLHHGKSRLVS